MWNVHSLSPIQKYTEHWKAVRAIAWSPHHRCLLAFGADRIHFYDMSIGQLIQSVDTDSQVFNLAWSKHSFELVSTHDNSQNQVLVWKYPSLIQVAELSIH